MCLAVVYMEAGFSQIQSQMELTTSSIFVLYDPLADTRVSADASCFGLGVVILQRTEGI